MPRYRVRVLITKVFYADIVAQDAYMAQEYAIADISNYRGEWPQRVTATVLQLIEEKA